MNPYSLDTDSSEFWARQSANLEPLLGPLNTTLGDRWRDILLAHFTRHDHVAAHEIRRGAARTPWYIVEIHPAAERLRIDHPCQSAKSMAESLAHVMDRCAKTHMTPDKALRKEDGDRLELSRNGHPWVTIGLLRPTRASAESFQRALSALCCVRKAGQPYDEQLKRLRRWPGLHGLERDPNIRPRRQQMPHWDNEHLPVPKEWLLSAHRLCELAGKKSATSLAQQVAAAALGAASWNHLSAPHGDLTPELVTPWALYDTYSRESPIALYANPFDGLADVVQRFPLLTAGWPSVIFEELDSVASLSLGEYSFRSAVHPGEFQEGDLDVNRENPRFCLASVEHVPAIEQAFLHKATIALSFESGDAILELLGAQLEPMARARQDDQINGEQHVATDANWRFTIQAGTESSKPSLRAWQLDHQGQAVFDAAVPLYKGLLLYYSDLDAHVLSGDYDGDSPRALIRGLSRHTVEVLQGILNETKSFTMTRERLKGRSQGELDRLIAREQRNAG